MREVSEENQMEFSSLQRYSTGAINHKWSSPETYGASRGYGYEILNDMIYVYIYVFVLL